MTAFGLLAGSSSEYALASHASILSTDESDLSVQKFFQSIEAKLPPILGKALSSGVRVRFVELDHYPVIEPPACPGEQPVKRLKPSILARTRAGSSMIELNRNWLKELKAGEGGARTYLCGHKNLYRLAQATVIHELGHIYDELNLPATQDSVEKKEREWCARTQEEGASPVSKCAELDTLRTTVSTRPQFKQLVENGAGLFGTKFKNTLKLRSADPYEFKSTKESFAVNLEFFLLDAEYACRRPSYARFYSEHFGFSPNFSIDCRTMTTIRLHSSLVPVNLDPSRVYEVHYFLAAKGEEAASRFGHAMFRVILCSPKREEVGPDCLKDVSHHMF